MKAAVDLLVRNVEGCDSASISLVHAKRRVETPAASDALSATGDRLQAEFGEGPALDTLWDVDTVHVPDLSADPRWPPWGPGIGQAWGLIMERYVVDAPRAFAVLTRLSSTHEVKLREVALELIHTRRLPTPPPDKNA